MQEGATVAAVTGQLAVVEAWLDAVDRADAAAAMALCAPDVEVVGPRGSVRGREVLGPAATAGTRRHVTGPYRLEVLDGVPHWIPELAAERAAELVVAHTRSVTAPR